MPKIMRRLAVVVIALTGLVGWSLRGAVAATLTVGDILVVDHLYGVVQIDPETGAQTLVTTGGYLNTISNSARGIAIERNGQILVIDTAIALADGSVVGGVVRVDPATGAQSLLTSGGLLDAPVSVAVEADGQIVVTARAGVIRIHPVTGAQRLASSGGYLSGPQDIAIVETKPKK